ncbi:hypothetical protein DVS28_b0222 (plasmid) [Euzebya pacifica]|uniref:Uncharacterized protein n=1 Tax=Euzebya pacifica TaxID=1608957 RepID=A0A346Y695_9ACTN|nr:hypothetical protein [Euzebya pacifica]AXV09992.1 hypothetical protein DVS28_b0222 [Euzebya pacifica]
MPTRDDYTLPADEASALATSAARLDERLDRIIATLDPALAVAARRVTAAVRMLPAGDRAPESFRSFSGDLAEPFRQEEPGWRDDGDAFMVEVASGNLATLADDWAHGRPDPDGDPWPKRLSAVTGGLIALDGRLG